MPLIVVLSLILMLSVFSPTLVAAQYHTVSKGETLYLIAQWYNVTVWSLKSANNLQTDTVYPGQRLLIPGSSTGSSDRSQQKYTVRAGDSLWSIAAKFGTSVSAIKQANGLSSNTIYVGQTLVIPGGSPTKSSGRKTVYVHQVKWGDSVDSLANLYGTNSWSIKSTNMLSSNWLQSWAAVIVSPSWNHNRATALSIPANVSVSDFHKLARIVYAEAGGEPYSGQVAVAAVVLNRTKSSAFPNTMDGVLTQKYQFEAVLNGYYYQNAPSMTAYKAAADALNGWDPTYGALYFFNPSKISNQWLLSKPVTYRVGSHVFAR